MPPLDVHLKNSKERTGKDFREIHEWLDGDPEKKAERHDITKVYEYGKMVKERYGEDALQEYLQHINDDVKTKFTHIQHDLEKAITDALAYFGVK
jgi:hypothetical protein